MNLRILASTAVLLAFVGLTPMFGWLNWFTVLVALLGFAAYAQQPAGRRPKVWRGVLWATLVVGVVRLVLGGGFF